jgi:hypothetical protein
MIGNEGGLTELTRANRSGGTVNTDHISRPKGIKRGNNQPTPGPPPRTFH